MKTEGLPGGYEDGYASCNCFWGTSPGSLVKAFIEENPSLDGLRVLDLGCGEGKNAAAFARAGAVVVAVDCSARALVNGRRAFPDLRIDWRLSDARAYLNESGMFDVIVIYGLLHCLPVPTISPLVQLALQRTCVGGYHFVVAFNDGPHDLSAHPNFSPTLLPHDFYVQQYSDQTILRESNAVIRETHPNNNIPHFHSLTRMMVKKTQ